MAANRGCKLVKSRRRKAGTGDFGRFGLRDAASERDVFGFGADGLLTATPDEIEAFLRKGAVADWKSSLAAAAAPAAAPANDERTPVSKSTRKGIGKEAPAAPPPRPARKLRAVERSPQQASGPPAPPSPPPPPPPPAPPVPAPAAILKIREARTGDAEALAALLSEADTKALAARVTALRKAGEPPLVAEQGGDVLGVVAWHAMPLLQGKAPLGRITLLFVAPAARRRGIGRALLEDAAARLGDRGCTHVEAFAEIELAAAPDFFRRLGWKRDAYRYMQELSAG
jgi:N-acetylglutamate synthase-like GNAT family acetyltransferase